MAGRVPAPGLGEEGTGKDGFAGGDGGGHALLVSTLEQEPVCVQPIEFVHEAVVHRGAEVFTVAQAVLDERDVGGSEQVEVVVAAMGERIDLGGQGAGVAFMPEAGGEAVGVADEDAVGEARQLVFQAVLHLGDEGELGRGPLGGTGGGTLAFGIEATDFGDPGGLKVGSEGAGEGSGAGGFGTEHADAAGKVGADGRIEVLPVLVGVVPDGGAGDGDMDTGLIDLDVAAAEMLGPRVAVVFGGEDYVGGPAEEAAGVGGPEGGVVIMAEVFDRNDVSGRMHVAQPVGAEGSGDQLAGMIADGNGDGIGLCQCRLDEE